MEATNQNKADSLLDPKKAKAWIITLALGIVVCTGLIIYSSITSHPAINFLDSSLFKPGLVFQGFLGIILFIQAHLFLGISKNLFESLPGRERLAKLTAIVGTFLLLSTCILLFFSYDLETRALDFKALVTLGIANNIRIFDQVIEQKFNKFAKILSLTGAIAFLTGCIFLIFSFDS